MSRTRQLQRALAASVVFFLGQLATSQPSRADDTALFTTAVPPNVVFLVDTSGSMREIMYHPEYDPTASTCAIFDRIEPNDASPSPESGTGTKNDTSYNCDANTNHCRFQIDSDETGYAESSSTIICPDGSSESVGYIERSFCGNTRKMYIDPCQSSTTWYSEWYVEWYFSDAADPYFLDAEGNSSTDVDMIDADDNGTDYFYGTTFPLYKRSRITAARQIARDVIYQTNGTCGFGKGATCTDFKDEVRFGLARFFGSHGAYITAALDDYSNNQSQLNSAINSLSANASTPLAESLFKVYTYFMSRVESERPFGQEADDPAVADPARFPEYSYRLSDGQFSSSSSEVPPDPLACPGGETNCPCQKHFVIVLSDGDPFNDDFSTKDDDTVGFEDFDALIGDFNDDSEVETGYLSNGTLYLDDVAKFMSSRDFRLDQTGDQTIDVYTVGFNLDEGGLGGQLLQKTADVGNGLSFFGTQASEVTAALLSAIEDIIEKSQSFTAATVPASRATDGNNFFTSYFDPSEKSPYWAGHLKLFEFNAAGEIRDAPTAAQAAAGQSGDCALDDPVSGRCAVGRLKIELDGFWDAGREIPSATEGVGGRRLYVSKLVSGASELRPFTSGEISAADLLPGLAGSIGSYDRFDYDVSGITSLEELADAIVGYVRGCELRAGACQDRGPGKKLWDIFHSNPVVVGPPNTGLRESSYREFVDRYKRRKRVIYGGSNGGFVHGFNAGEFDTASAPGAYDRGDGVEEFGFMSYAARQGIAELPLNAPRTRYYMDGSITSADVWIDPSGLLSPDVAANWRQWRTVLLGGMREGGRTVWALDVTNPPDHNSPAGEQATGPAYPGYLWEFPCESTADATCTGSGFLPTGMTLADYMGESWSQPVVTRVRVTVGCDFGDDGCAPEPRWVAIFGGGYDAAGDPNLAHESNPTDLEPLEYDASNEAGTSVAGRALFMVDVSSGKVLAMKRYDHLGTSGDSADGEPEMRFAMPARPAVFDIDRDGFADVVYIGDLGGNLWKWVVEGAVRDPIADVSGDVLQPDWPFLKILEAGGCTSCSPPHYKSFYSAPTGALVGANLWLALGSGERNDLDFGQDGGLSAAERNRYYVFKDVDPLERERDPADLPLTDVSGPDFLDVASISSNVPGACLGSTGGVGFYIEGEDGEKFLTDSAIFFGVVLTGSFKPAGSTRTACEAGGDAFLYGFKLFCGDGVFPPSSGNGSPLRRVSIGSGMPTTPRVSVGPAGSGGGGGGGCADMVVVITSDGQALSDCPGGRPDAGINLKSWRDF